MLHGVLPVCLPRCDREAYRKSAVVAFRAALEQASAVAQFRAMQEPAVLAIALGAACGSASAAALWSHVTPWRHRSPCSPGYCLFSLLPDPPGIPRPSWESQPTAPVQWTHHHKTFGCNLEVILPILPPLLQLSRIPAFRRWRPSRLCCRRTSWRRCSRGCRLTRWRLRAACAPAGGPLPRRLPCGGPRACAPLRPPAWRATSISSGSTTSDRRSPLLCPPSLNVPAANNRFASSTVTSTS